jgi:hypothetical protein
MTCDIHIRYQSRSIEVLKLLHFSKHFPTNSKLGSMDLLISMHVMKLIRRNVLSDVVLVRTLIKWLLTIACDINMQISNLSRVEILPPFIGKITIKQHLKMANTQNIYPDVLL